MAIPSYLSGYDSAYDANPREAALQWFRAAEYGLFMHYGLYSLLGRHEWVQFKEKIPVDEYALLKCRFTASGFDAERIAETAVAAGMKYVNLTTRHHDGFCLFDTKETDFNSASSPARRDLVRELAVACEKRGLGLFLYYSHGRDWRHPHAPNNDEYPVCARPDYDPVEPSYAYGDAHNLHLYLDFVSAQIRELLTNYGPIAGIWLDGIATPLSGNWRAFDCQKLYDMIHDLQPQVLVSYKQGLLGTEDYLAPENDAVDGRSKPVEICTTMCPHSWGYLESGVGKHKTAEEVWNTLHSARKLGCNLLLNTGLLPDGSVDSEDEVVLQEVGEKLVTHGMQLR